MNELAKAITLATIFGGAVMAGPAMADGSYMDAGASHCIYMGNYALHVSKERLDGTSKADVMAGIPAANKKFGIPSSLARDTISAVWKVDPKNIVFMPENAHRLAKVTIDERKKGSSKEYLLKRIASVLPDSGLTEGLIADIIEDVWKISPADLASKDSASLSKELNIVRDIEMGMGDIMSPWRMRANIYMNCRGDYENLLNELEFDDGAEVPTVAPKLDL